MRKIFVFMVLGIGAAISWGYALNTPDAQFNSEINTNADVRTGETTSMNGNTSTTAGVPISSTAASSESRNASGNGG